MNIQKRCNKIGCRALIATSDTYCDKHTNHSYKQYEQVRASTAEGREYKQFYSAKEWRALRYQVLLDAGFSCVECGHEATVGDHIIPTKVRWDLRLDINNIQALCHECHNKKTAEDKIKFGI